MSLSAETKIDVLTFEETAMKPFTLPQGQLAFEVFMPHMEALILDAIYNILKLGTKPSLSQLLQREESIDQAYLAKVVAACVRYRQSSRAQS